MIILPEDRKLIEMLSDSEAKCLVLALLDESGDVSALTPLALMAYTVIRDKADRFSKKQSENGSKGGRPKTQKTQENPKKPTEPKKASTTVTVTSTVTDTVTDMSAVVVADAHARESTELSNSTAELRRICEYYLDRVSSALSPSLRDDFGRYLADGMSADVVIDALDRAIAEGKRTGSYINGILRNRRDNRVLTMADVAAEAEQYAARRQSQRSPPTQKRSAERKSFSEIAEEEERNEEKRDIADIGHIDSSIPAKLPQHHG